MKKLEKRYPRLIPVAKWNEFHIYPPIGQLRHLIMTNPDGFEKVIKRVCKRVLIDEDAWFDWVEKQTLKEIEK